MLKNEKSRIREKVVNIPKEAISRAMETVLDKLKKVLKNIRWSSWGNNLSKKINGMYILLCFNILKHLFSIVFFFPFYNLTNWKSAVRVLDLYILNAFYVTVQPCSVFKKICPFSERYVKTVEAMLVVKHFFTVNCSEFLLGNKTLLKHTYTFIREIFA